jgi:hypothetical protein
MRSVRPRYQRRTQVPTAYPGTRLVDFRLATPSILTSTPRRHLDNSSNMDLQLQLICSSLNMPNRGATCSFILTSGSFKLQYFDLSESIFTNVPPPATHISRQKRLYMLQAPPIMRTESHMKYLQLCLYTCSRPVQHGCIPEATFFNPVVAYIVQNRCSINHAKPVSLDYYISHLSSGDLQPLFITAISSNAARTSSPSPGHLKRSHPYLLRSTTLPLTRLHAIARDCNVVLVFASYLQPTNI